MASHTWSGRHGLRAEEHYRTHGFTDTPLVVQWMATLRCGLSCPHCLAAGEGEAPSDMPLDEAIDLVDQAAEMGVHELLVTGGEPLIRQDLPEVINHLGQRNQTWSLNTSAMPSPAMRRAIEAHRPAFVAVSLDGPEPLHDAFRGRAGNFDEVLESLRYFASLEGVHTAAGTTVTSANISRLDQTRRIVQELDVNHWGIHLLVPEGRAAVREDLELTPRQKRKLLADVARWRRTLPVSLADEIGYCGPGEAMLRNEPFACGAGRTQCVVLPDGHVVPCNTLDIRTAGGTLHGQSLAEIWRSGFRELRHYRPAGKCRSCEHASACGGGCWLHRRAGTQCSKDVWQGAAWTKAAAGVAICLAGLAGAQTVCAQEPANPLPRDQMQVVVVADNLAQAEQHIERVWLSRLTRARDMTGSDGGPNHVPENLTDQPVWKMIDLWQRGKLPEKMEDRCELIEAVLKSDCENLGVLGLALQTIADPIVGGAWPVDQRTVEQQSRLGQIFVTLNTKAMLAQQQYIAAAIEQYKAGRGLPYRPMSKAIRPGEGLHRNLVYERLGLTGVKEDEILAGLAKSKFDPLWARAMQIRVEPTDKNTLSVIRPGHDQGKTTDATVGPFDAIESREEDAPVKVRISWPGEPKQAVTLSLPGGKTMYWADLLHAVGCEAGTRLGKELSDKLSKTGIRIEPNPLYLPVMRELPDTLQDDENSERHNTNASQNIPTEAMHWLAAFWML